MANKIATYGDIWNHVDDGSSLRQDQCVSLNGLRDWVKQGETCFVNGINVTAGTQTGYALKQLVPLSKISFGNTSCTIILTNDVPHISGNIEAEIWCGNNLLGRHSFVESTVEDYRVGPNLDDIRRDGLKIVAIGSEYDSRLVFSCIINNVGFDRVAVNSFECSNRSDGSYDNRYDPTMAMYYKEENVPNGVIFSTYDGSGSYEGRFSFTLNNVSIKVVLASS